MMKSKFVFMGLLSLYRIIIVFFQFNVDHKESINNYLLFSLMSCLLIKRDSEFDGYIIIGLIELLRYSWFDTVYPLPYFSHLEASPLGVFLALYVLIHWSELRVELEELCSQT